MKRALPAWQRFLIKLYNSAPFFVLAEVEPFVRLFTFGEQPRFTKLVVAEIESRKSQRVLQAGGAPGKLSQEIARVVGEEGELSLVDVSENALRVAKRKLRGLRNVRYVRADAGATAFPPDSFDAFVSFFLLHEVPLETKFRVLDEAACVLRHGGLLCIVDYHKGSGRGIAAILEKFFRLVEPWSGELMDMDLAGELRARGFRVARINLGKLGLYQFVVAEKQRQ